jgi:hypothetical protein
VSNENSLRPSLDAQGGHAPTPRRAAQLDDQLALTRDIAGLIWQHKLWWLVPVLVALLALTLLLVLEATPVGPLLYPLF